MGEAYFYLIWMNTKNVNNTLNVIEDRIINKVLKNIVSDLKPLVKRSYLYLDLHKLKK
jgi:hypothetical protein